MIYLMHRLNSWLCEPKRTMQLDHPGQAMQYTSGSPRGTSFQTLSTSLSGLSELSSRPNTSERQHLSSASCTSLCLSLRAKCVSLHPPNLNLI